MEQIETIILDKFDMIEYLEGKRLFIGGRWQEVVNHRVQGCFGVINLMLYTPIVLEDLVRKVWERENDSTSNYIDHYYYSSRYFISD